MISLRWNSSDKYSSGKSIHGARISGDNCRGSATQLHLPKLKLFDVRGTRRSPARTERSACNKSHIAGAINMPYQLFLDERTGLFKERDIIASIFDRCILNWCAALTHPIENIGVLIERARLARKTLASLLYLARSFLPHRGSEHCRNTVTLESRFLDLLSPQVLPWDLANDVSTIHQS